MDRKQDLRCGRLMVDKRYRKIFNIKPFNIKNKLNQKTLKELFDNPKIAVSNVNDNTTPMRVVNSNKHSINMENTDSSNSSNSVNENSSGRMKNNINSQVGKNRNNNDLYELLYGLK